MSSDWEGNRKSGDHWPCVTDFSGLSTYVQEMSTPPTLLMEYGTLYLFYPVGVRNIAMRVYVCLFVCALSYLKKRTPNFTVFVVLPNGIRYLLMVLWMTP